MTPLVANHTYIYTQTFRILTRGALIRRLTISVGVGGG